MDKFDFENVDTKLYLALRKFAKDYKDLADSGDAGFWKAEEQPAYQQAMLAMREFEASLGPLPKWAIARNWDYSPVVGAQLLTRDGRQHGNAHIIHIDDAGNHGDVFYLLTDAGNPMQRSEVELLASFYIGDFISPVDYVLDSFDRNNHYPEFRQ